MMEKYKFINEKYDNKILFFLFFILFYIGRDTLTANCLLGFLNSQIITVILIFIVTCIFLYNNRLQLTLLLRDKRTIVFITLSIIFLLPMLVKRDFQLMYFSIFFCIYFAYILSFIVEFKDLCKWFVITVSFFSLFSLITTYLLKYLAIYNVIPSVIFSNSSGLKFYNYLFSYSVIYENYLRNFGIFREPGVFQFFIFISIFLCLYQIKWNCKKNKYVILILLTITMFSTFSTSGVIEMIFLYIFYFFEKKLYKNKLILGILSFLIFCTLFFLIYGINNRGLLYLTLNNQFSKLFSFNSSSSPRIMSIFSNLKIFLNHPLVGDTVMISMSSVSHNTSSSLILFSILGLLGGMFNLLIWINFIKKYQFSNIFFLLNLLVVFLSFNTQALIGNIFFWVIPTFLFFDCIHQIINKYGNLFKKIRRKYA